MDTLFDYLRKQQARMLTMLQRFVEAESPSTNKAKTDALAAIAAAEAREFGGTVRILPSRQTGNHLRAEFPPIGPSKGRILLLGHLDTVWECGTIRQMPFRIRNGRAFGPGIFDMKSGIVIGLFAVHALQTLGIPKKRIVLLLNADEEVGSPSSRPITEREAKRSDCALVLEPAAGPKGALKTARKGVGEFQLRVTGRSAHAGLDPRKGASAVMELCRQIVSLDDLADSGRGITVNAGIISGGTRTNVIPAEAMARVDVRVARMHDMKEMERRFRALKPYDRETALEVSGRFNRPPLERSAAIGALFRRAKAAGRRLGLSLEEAAVGGGSDGNFTAALGVPTLDGLGGVGDGAHADHEHIIIRELPRRAALLAHLIASL
jgi:glutamate carboxypeptidase